MGRILVVIIQNSLSPLHRYIFITMCLNHVLHGKIKKLTMLLNLIHAQENRVIVLLKINAFSEKLEGIKLHETVHLLRKDGI